MWEHGVSGNMFDSKPNVVGSIPTGPAKAI